MINATGDEFFLPDSSKFYFDDLPGEKYLYYVPNVSHSLGSPDVQRTLEAFYHSVVTGSPRPRMEWKIEPDGTIRAQADQKPSEVKMWQATNPQTRDFRYQTIGPAWRSAPLAPREGVYVARAGLPPQGWTAYFIEMTFPGKGRHPFRLTTGVKVVPDKLPFPPPKSGR
jgi:PhoPQ-activated pathogenicity-related protein